MDKIEIIPVKSRKDKKEFIHFPWKIYKDDPHWVPPLIMEQKELLNPKKHPFHKHAEVEFFLAKLNGQYVGRIAAIVNHNHNSFHNEKTGFFGFFESIDNKEVADSLLSTAEKLLINKGMERMRGPASFSSNEIFGLLVDGFGSSPKVMMPYNPPGYINFLENYGLNKIKELNAYYFYKDNPFISMYKPLVEKVKKEYNVTVRTINMKDFQSEIIKIKEVYNRAWSKNWGFVPMTDEEIDHMAKGLKQIGDPNLLFFAEINSEPIGFGFSLPDLNTVLKKLNGRLFPFGLVKLMLLKSKIKSIRMLNLGVVEDFRHVGIEGLIQYETVRNMLGSGYVEMEASWILAENIPMNKILQKSYGRIYKKYAIFEKELFNKIY